MFVKVFFIGVWALLLSLFLGVSGQVQVKAFDPDLALSDSWQTGQIERQLNQYHAPIDNGFVLFTRSNCHCEFINHDFIVHTKQLAKAHALVVSEVENDNFAFSTPAAAVWRHGKLQYFGPLAEGLFCSRDTDMVSRYIENDALTPAVITEASGCFCRNKTT